MFVWSFVNVLKGKDLLGVQVLTFLEEWFASYENTKKVEKGTLTNKPSNIYKD